MASKENVYHHGTIEKVGPGIVEVRILQQSACGKCHAKSMCSISDMKEKIVEVHTTPQQHFSEGEEVTVVMQRTMGMKAVLLAYFLPFILLMITLISVWSWTGSEGLAGLLALGILVPYFLILFLLRDRMKKEFIFKIQAV